MKVAAGQDTYRRRGAALAGTGPEKRRGVLMFNPGGPGGPGGSGLGFPADLVVKGLPGGVRETYGSALDAAYASMFPETADRVVVDSNIGDTHLDRGGMRRYALSMEQTFPGFAKWAAALWQSYLAPELAEIAGTTLKTVRHYHRIGLPDEPERAANGYKRYRITHLVRLLRRINAILYPESPG